jgi:hypothetical protein
MTDIWNFEDAIEPAAVQILQTAFDGQAQVLRARDIVPQTSPWISVEFVPGEFQGHYAMINAVPYPDTWNGRLTVSIATDRRKNQANHAGLRATVRRHMHGWNAFNAILDAHWITSISESGTTPSMMVDDEIDLSAVEFNVVFSIRRTAFSVS